MVKDRTPSNPSGLRDLPFSVPSASAAEKRHARKMVKLLRERHPDAHCELEYGSPHELLIATILSAQATDVGVNKATPGLFAAFPSPADYAAASPEKIEPYIKTIGLFRNKAKSVHSAMTTVVEEFGGEVPRTMEGLLSLRGVARKTANVVLGEAFGIHEGVVVDTHVQRVATRLGMVPDGETVAMIERHLIARVKREDWAMLSHLLIFHGRRVCTARGHSEEDLYGDPICSRYCERAAAERRELASRGTAR